MVCVSPERVAAGHEDGSWQTVRRMTGPHLRVVLDDLDPFRDGHEWPAAGPLSTAQWLAWRRGLTTAGTRLASALPGYAGTLAAGLRTVVPLRRGRASHWCGPAQQPFGAVGLAFPRDPRALDALLLHQFQHAKLDAVLGLRELLRPGPRPGLRVPWRKLPQRPESVLHDAYAHLALAHLSQSRGPSARTAYLRHRSRVRAGGAALLATRAPHRRRRAFPVRHARGGDGLTSCRSGGNQAGCHGTSTSSGAGPRRGPLAWQPNSIPGLPYSSSATHIQKAGPSARPRNPTGDSSDFLTICQRT